MQDETLLTQLEELRLANEESERQRDEMQKIFELKEEDYSEVLAAKEEELQEAQEAFKFTVGGIQFPLR